MKPLLSHLHIAAFIGSHGTPAVKPSYGSSLLPFDLSLLAESHVASFSALLSPAFPYEQESHLCYEQVINP